MGYASSWLHKSTLPGEAVSVLRARRFVSVHLVEHRLFYMLEDVRLVASELAANAVRHAHTPFTVILEHSDQSVLLTVQDGSLVPPVQVDADPMDTGGRGVWIVDLLSQDWGVTEGPGHGKSVWASFATR